MNLRPLSPSSWPACSPPATQCPSLEGDVSQITPVQPSKSTAPASPYAGAGASSRRVRWAPTPARQDRQRHVDRCRPRSMTEDGSGHFIACRTGFYDPASNSRTGNSPLSADRGYENRKIGLTDSASRASPPTWCTCGRWPLTRPRSPYPSGVALGGWEWSEGSIE